MPLRISPADFIAGHYTVRFAETHESILKTPGWRKSSHRYWGLDVGPVKGLVRVRGKLVRRDRNSVALYAPGVVYEENTEVGSLISWAWLLIEEKAEPSLLKRLTGNDGFCFLTDPTQLIRKQIRQFVEAAQGRGIERRFFLTAYLHEILGTLFSLQPDRPAGQPTIDKSWVHPWRKAAWDALERSTKGSLSSAELARELGVSISTLTHHYREYCGESLHDTVGGWRLEKACALLSGTELSIKQVAVQVGFSHQSYLSAFLKDALGHAPSEYRRLSKFRT